MAENNNQHEWIALTNDNSAGFWIVKMEDHEKDAFLSSLCSCSCHEERAKKWVSVIMGWECIEVVNGYCIEFNPESVKHLCQAEPKVFEIFEDLIHRSVARSARHVRT